MGSDDLRLTTEVGKEELPYDDKQLVFDEGLLLLLGQDG